MKSILLTFLFLLSLSVTATAQRSGAMSTKPAHTFGWQGENFLLDGKPFQIISGDMHYARVPRQYWRDRMRKMKAMGLNTLTTYIFWNLHEPRPGHFDFTGNLDIAAYVRTAQEEGLWVIVRPGPYVCSEWEFGGFPAWLLTAPDMKVRSSDPRFLKAAAGYMKEVGRQLAPLQITRGGPIIMAQVENEYGSFGSDRAYLDAVRRMISDAGFDVTLFTSDGDPSKLAQGSLPDLLSVINFGANDSPEKKFAVFDKFRQNVPRMCGEFWVGWFDAWGEKHQSVPAERAAEGLDWMLAHGISVNLYMFHGGSSFGFMNGANKYDRYQPDISSYDYDSPLDEAGRPTGKFFALRDVIKKHLPEGTRLPELPQPLPMIEIPRFELRESASLFNALSQPAHSERPQPMEALGQDYGLILYRKRLGRAASGALAITEMRDYALISQGDKTLGTLDRRLKQSSLQVELSGSAPLDILVENMGRVNFGPNMVTDRKGITEKVSLNGEELTGWEMYRMPLTDLSRLKFSVRAQPGPSFYKGTFKLASTGDTYLDMRGWGKGFVWVNGHNLGRYWRIGPQQSLFVPSMWLKQGMNEVIVLDLETGRSRSIQGIKELVFETPQITEQGAHGRDSMGYASPGKEAYLKFAEEAEEMLRRDVLGVWFPRTVDAENGGFHSNFTRDWKKSPSDGKFSVFQGRMTWIAAQIVMRRPDLKAQFLPFVQHGLDYLRNVMWDKQAGGFFWGLDDKGSITPNFTDGKHLYGMSFCLYGAAAAYHATKDRQALELAERAFRWIDEHAHDAKNGGYFEWLTRDGRVVANNAESGKVQIVPVAGFPLGYKSMNTHIHLLESFTELYGVWKDETLRRRLEELLSIVRDKICVEPGAMNLYFTNDWHAIPDHDSYGHDVETAYLMLEASEVLGQKNDSRTERMAKMLVDHALAYGWDETYGGFYREGTTTGKPEDMLKEWWAQMEGLNTLLLMHEKYGRERDVYFKAFQLQWQFIRDRQVDREFRGLYDTVERDGTPTSTPKARMWKAAYHDGRALLNVSERLRKLAATTIN